MATCGLDFGTSNSTVALPDGTALRIDLNANEPRLFRSVLFFAEEETGFRAGADAIAQYLDDGSGRFIQSVKSWLPSRSFHATQIRNASFKLEDLVAMLIRRIREKAEAAHGQPLTHVTLGRPAVFSPDPEADALAERRLRKAAETAGFKEVRFLIEPIAAALAYEATLTKDERVLVGDFGAGTSDFTLMHLGPSRRGNPERRTDVVGSSGVRIGGDNFDAAIMRYKLLPHFGAGSHYRLGSKRLPMPRHIESKLLSWHEMSFIRERSTQELLSVMLDSSEQPEAIAALHDLVMYNLGFHLFRAIERAKIQLSSEEETAVVYEEERIHLNEKIRRDEFDTFCQPLLSGLAECVDRLVAEHPTQTVDAVFLTGGSSHIPSVRKLFADRFGEGRLRTADAFTSVAEGLGRASAT